MPTTLQKEKINYDFIDSLRFIAIITIVLEHSYVWPEPKFFTTLGEQSIQLFTMQVFKFGTILFYILAGFLIGDKIHTTTSLQYLKRRFDGTFKPWLFWIVIFLLFIYGNLLVVHIKGSWSPMFDKPFYGLGTQLYDIIVNTSFWFILNFLGSISILLIFRKYLYSWKVGIFLGLCSLFYSLNLYHEWIYSQHTTAILGFVFYLWLGVILHKYFKEFNEWVKRRSVITLAIFTILALIAACLESLYLIKAGVKADPYNTLRVTNIIYSLISFVFLYRLGNPLWIKKLNPRSSTYGIHLVHYIIIVQILPTIFLPLNITSIGKTSFELVLLQYGRFILTYFVSYFIVYLINKSNKIKWIVGQ
ncbi:acyltransferase family protein [Pedobacter mucosus]|uniref:acyltransferase family protein n=1 Tax=Pedobacter mucosus TaxID=2895286 RepID=UPI001EE41FB0|nr:acyltransferase [Pedobacter mucosus]UKT63813.1 acyltransferase [Pedobacter mucosus]